jgi:hypothetical protein
VAAEFLFWEYLFPILGLGSLHCALLNILCASCHIMYVFWTNCLPVLLCLLPALQRQNTEISKQIFPEKEYRGLSPNFHIYTSVSDLYISTINLPILLEEICRPILGIYKSLTDTCGKWG